jgi:hypothetical protein
MSAAELDLVLRLLDEAPQDFYEALCEACIRLYPDTARELFGEPVPPHKAERAYA